MLSTIVWSRRRGQLETRTNEFWQRCRVRDRGQIAEAQAISEDGAGVSQRRFGGHLERQPRLTNAAGTDQGEHRRPLDGGRDLSNVMRSADGLRAQLREPPCPGVE